MSSQANINFWHQRDAIREKCIKTCTSLEMTQFTQRRMTTFTVPKNYSTIYSLFTLLQYLKANVDWSLWEASFWIVFGTPTIDIVIILCPICTSWWNKKRQLYMSLLHLKPMYRDLLKIYNKREASCFRSK